MTIKQFGKIIDVVRNGGVVIAERCGVYCIDNHEITENTNIQDIFNYNKEGYSFYIKDNTKTFSELEEII